MLVVVAPFDHKIFPLQPLAVKVVLLPKHIVPPPLTVGILGLGLILTSITFDNALLQEANEQSYVAWKYLFVTLVPELIKLSNNSLPVPSVVDEVIDIELLDFHIVVQVPAPA